MQRILDPSQIETYAQQPIVKIRLPERSRLFSARAERLRAQAGNDAVGNTIGDYLRLMAAVADAQQAAVSEFSATPPDTESLARAREHRMPPLLAIGFPRDPRWRGLLPRLCEAIAAQTDVPVGVRNACQRLRAASAETIETQADAMLAGRDAQIDTAVAPFLMAALQIYWVALASRLDRANLAALDVAGVCPVCGTLPVASVVRADGDAQSLRYLHCALCASEWYLVRITCSQCQANDRIAYYTIKNGPPAIRAETCDHCKTYRKILYQEQDAKVEPVADDLASLALDLLMGEAGYHRASGNPLLWQNA